MLSPDGNKTVCIKTGVLLGGTLAPYLVVVVIILDNALREPTDGEEPEFQLTTRKTRHIKPEVIIKLLNFPTTSFFCLKRPTATRTTVKTLTFCEKKRRHFGEGNIF